MTLDEYQKAAISTAIYPKEKDGYKGIGLLYTALGLGGEAGEVLEEIKKMLRSEENMTFERKEKIIFELGDLLWYIAAMATELGEDLDLIAAINLEKLKDRYGSSNS